MDPADGEITMTWRERVQLALGPGMFAGLTASDWASIARKNRIDVRYWLRAASATQYSLMTSVVRQLENHAFLTKVMGVQIKSPIFVLGHCRSGTTHLHNLLAVDQRFA
jgi:hypothetical protein